MIKAEEAVIRAQYRLIKVFRSKLEDECDPLNDLNNPLFLPANESYFVAGDDEVMMTILNAQNSGCFIAPVAPSTISAVRTGDGNVRGKIHTTIFRVTFLFKKPGAYENFAVDGVNVMETELMYHMADRIRGGAFLAVYKYAVDTDNIHDVEVINVFADVVTTTNNELMGRATLEISVIQNVEVPMPTYDAL